MEQRNFFEKILFGGGVLFDFFKWVSLCIIAVILINTYWVAVFIVDGESMYPNLKDKELVLWERNTYKEDGMAPGRGDIVIVRYPGDPKNKKYVKRLIGLPGEKVSIRGGSVYINNQLLKEKYLSYDLETDPGGEWKLGSNEYFILGDNRPNSNDSRYFGPVEKRFLLGRALSIVFPRFLIVQDM